MKEPQLLFLLIGVHCTYARISETKKTCVLTQQPSSLYIYEDTLAGKALVKIQLIYLLFFITLFILNMYLNIL